MLYILIRHGQCLTNFDRNYAVSSNDEDILTDSGCDQAYKTAQFLTKLKITKARLASSPLARARQTAEIIFKELAPDTEIRYSDLLIEKSRDESYADACQRFKSFVEGSETRDNQVSVIITHGHLLQAVFANLMGLREPNVLDFQNCSISTYENGRVLTINSYFHLLKQ